MRRPETREEIITKVNVTPIIDVALVLVIILLVTAPMLAMSDLPVNLPAANTRESEDERNVCITLATNGAVALDEHEVTREVLGKALAARLAEPGNQDVLVVVRADSGLPYAEVRKVLEEARAAGARRLSLATRQKTRSEP